MLMDSLKQLSGLGPTASSASSKAGQLAQASATAATATGAASATNAKGAAGATSPSGQASQLQQQLDTLSQWSVSADVARQLAKNQQAEQQIRQLYQQLEQLKKQLNQSSGNGGVSNQQISQQLQQLEQALKSKHSALKPDLQLSNQSTALKQWQLNSKIDLLTPRKQAEQLTVLLPDSQRVQLQFAANQSAKDSLSHLQQQFASADIHVSQQGPALLFSAASAQQHLLSQSWLMQGEGVRVAAGNPVQVRLQKPDGQLQLLAQQARQLEQGDSQPQQLQAELSQVQQKLQQLLRQVQSERQLLLSKLNALQMAGEQQSVEQAADVSRELRLQMQHGAASSMSAIMAQGNVSRSLVEFALSD